MNILNEYINYCHKAIFTNKNALEYLYNRGINKKSIENFRLGFDDSKFLNSLTNEGFKDFLDSKLIYIPKDVPVHNYHTKFANRIIIPVLQNNEVVSITSRAIYETEKKHMHLNGSFHIPFNVDTINTKDYLCITESPLDAVILEQEGFNAISIFGTNNFKKEYADLLKNFKGKIIWIFDSDLNQAGLKGSLKNAWSLLIWVNINSFIGILPQIKGQDKTDINILYLGDKKEFKNVINQTIKDSLSYIDTIHCKEEHDKAVEKFKKTEISKETKNRVERIKSINITDLVQHYLPNITKTNFGFLGLCPFHADKNTKSLMGYNNNNIFLCFSGVCGKKGDSINFVREMFGLSFINAVKKIEMDFNIN